MPIELKDNYYFRILTVVLFTLLSIAGIAFSIYILLAATNAYIYVFGGLLLVLSCISGFFNIVSAVFYYKSYFYKEYFENLQKNVLPLKSFPTVAVAMPVFNEEPKIVKKNMLRLMQVDYPKDKVAFYLLDDSDRKEISTELEAFSKKNGVHYLHRTGRTGFKAGNLNNMLKNSKEEFVAIFDYDEYLTNKKFLKDLMPFFSDQKLGYVQTEKSCFKGNLLSDSVNLFDAFFYKFIQPARAFNNTAIFSGSCGIIRKSVLEEIGGFPEYCIEDTFFSFESDMHGYKGLHIPKIYAYGKPITSFTGLVRQQKRYNYGCTQFLFYFMRRKGQKKRSAWWTAEYITHGFGLNYLSLMLILFTITSVMIVFSNLPFIHVTLFQLLSSSKSTLLDLELFGIVAFTISVFTPALLTKIYFNSAKKGMMIFLLNFALAVVRTKAAIAALFRLDPKAQWSSDRKGNKSNLLYSIFHTRYEIAFSSVLFVFAYFAELSQNISGSLWLVFYAFLYLCATLMIYKYG